MSENEPNEPANHAEPCGRTLLDGKECQRPRVPGLTTCAWCRPESRQKLVEAGKRSGEVRRIRSAAKALLDGDIEEPPFDILSVDGMRALMGHAAVGLLRRDEGAEKTANAIASLVKTAVAVAGEIGRDAEVEKMRAVLARYVASQRLVLGDKRLSEPLAIEASATEEGSDTADSRPIDVHSEENQEK